MLRGSFMPKKRMRIVVVEDDEAMAYVIKKAFADRNETVHWDLCFAKDGQEALDCLFKADGNAHKNVPNLVLLDWNLPKVNGRSVLQKIKSSEKLRALPVLVFSSSQDENDIRDAYNGHANGYIEKPAGMEALKRIIDSIENFWVHTIRQPRWHADELTAEGN